MSSYLIEESHHGHILRHMIVNADGGPYKAYQRLAVIAYDLNPNQPMPDYFEDELGEIERGYLWEFGVSGPYIISIRRLDKSYIDRPIFEVPVEEEVQIPTRPYRRPA